MFVLSEAHRSKFTKQSHGAYRTLIVFVVAVFVLQASCDRQLAQNDNSDSAPGAGGELNEGRPKANVVAASTEANQHSPASQLTRESSPQEVCREFLRALQNKDPITAQQLLTSVAVMETHRASLELAFPGGTDSTFEVVETQYASANRQTAQVASIIRQADPSIPPFHLSWIMKLQRMGWKVSGMTFQNEDDGTIDLLSFENPVDVARIKSALTEESSLDAPGNGETRQAKSPTKNEKRMK